MASISAAHLIDNVAPADHLKGGSDKANAHWHEYDAVLLTNSAAGSTAVGDVLAVSVAGASAAVLGDTSASLQKFVVAAAVIANGATGEFARSGIVSAKAQGAIALGQYVKKSATARAVDDAGASVAAATVPPNGSLGIALAAAAGGLVTILLFDETVANPFILGVGVSKVILVRKAADGAAVNNSTTFASDPELTFTAEANAVYAIEITAFYESNEAADIKFQMTGPSGTFTKFVLLGLDTAAASRIEKVSMQITGGACGGIGAGNALVAKISVLYDVGGSGGACTLQWAQNTLHASDTKVLAGSYMIVTKG